MEAEITITEADLKEAVSEWIRTKGLQPTDRFSVTVTTYPGDRPFESDYTSIRLSGVRVNT